MQPAEIQTLAEQVREGDERAFARLFDTFASDLCAFAFRLVRDPSAAEEVVQEVFVHIWINRISWVPQSVKSYLYSSVRNRSLDVLKHERIVREEEAQVRAALYPAEATEADDYVYQEFVIAVEKAVSELPEGCRTVFSLSRSNHLSYKEIAGVLGISVKTVESQMHRAFVLLQKKLEPHLGRSVVSPRRSASAS